LQQAPDLRFHFANSRNPENLNKSIPDAK